MTLTLSSAISVPIDPSTHNRNLLRLITFTYPHAFHQSTFLAMLPYKLCISLSHFVFHYIRSLIAQAAYIITRKSRRPGHVNLIIY